SLVHAGAAFGIDEFLLVQWLAPLASEAPELIVAALLVWRGQAAIGLGALISSKVNQWTLLVGTLPLAYSVGLGRPDALVLDARQSEELILTAAQSLFAVAVLLNRRLSLWEAGALAILFVMQAAIPDPTLRALYVLLYF